MKRFLPLALGVLTALSADSQAQTVPAGPPSPPAVTRPTRPRTLNNAPVDPATAAAARAAVAAAQAAPAPGNGGGAGLDDAIVPPTGNLGALAPDAVLPAGTLTRLQSAPLEQVLQIYALVTGRIVLRPNTLPAAQLTLDASQMELTKDEAIQALDSVLSLNGITMIPVGSKFVTAVPTAQALQEAAAFSDVDSEDLPEAGQFVTKIVQLKYAPPSEIMPLVQGFSKIQNGIVPIDSTMTMVIRDNAANVKRMMEIINRVDVEVERDYKLEVIPIKYGTVEEIYATMGSLIGGGAGGGVGGAATTQRTGMQGGTGQRSNTRSNLGSQRSSSS
ncbi:MAG: secretin N-terminal domain-containing protein, partial [Limisphaerales bacterium]